MYWPRELYSAAQVRELDRRAIEQCDISADTLMARAGRAAFQLLRARWPRARRVVVVCGPGNNGGDGYVLARLAAIAGIEARVLCLGDHSKLAGAARAAAQACQVAGVPVTPFSDDRLVNSDVVVDAIFGTGLERAVTGHWAHAIDAMSARGQPLLALDIPSGLHGDTGAVLGCATRADATISFIGLKLGLFTGAGREHAGSIYLDDLGVPAKVYEGLGPLARRLVSEDLRELLPYRARDAHKGRAGRVLMVGGGPGMPGAVRMAGEAAYRVGTGLVTVATAPEHAAITNLGCPELIVRGVRDAADLRPLLATADCVAVGPGLGRDNWARELLAVALEARKPLVVDADALNLLAVDPVHREDWVLTPHPGEAARLIDASSSAAVQDDRITALRAITAKFGGSCVLKGSGTLIGTHREDEINVCDRGNPAMASAGMGDVLTGVIAGLIAQGVALPEAARLGVWLHATAGDRAANRAERGVLATDVCNSLHAALDELITR